jgi:acyl-CoA thioester hydrolase
MTVSLTDFKHRVPITIRFADMDAMGHVNNAKYSTYFETARITYIHEVCQPESFYTASVILAKMTIEFKLPLTVGDEIAILTRCSRLGNRSFDLDAVIARYNAEGNPEIAAISQAVMVAYDYTTHQTMPLAPAWRERISAYENISPH